MNLSVRLTSIYYRMSNSLGFYPAIITVGYLIFAVAVLSLQFSVIGRTTLELFPWLRNIQVTTSKAVFTTLVTGIISLTVLSFSMVMVVLSNTASTFSPKLVLGLVSERSHQIVLGNYIGTIVYCLVSLLVIPNESSAFFVSIAVIIAVMIGIWCLVLFVYFIHRISVSIQINNIMQGIYNETRKELVKRRSLLGHSEAKWQAIDEQILPRYQFLARNSGFFQKVDVKDLVKLASANGLVIRMNHPLRDFVVEGTPFFSCTQSPDRMDAELIDLVYGMFVFFPGEKVDINYIYGFTQLMEIAIKALSPGINDSGIACNCIDYLTDLFALRFGLREQTVYYDSSNKPRLILPSLTFEVLFNLCIGPIRLYGKEDLAIARQLLTCFRTLAHFDKTERLHQAFFNQQATSVIENIKNCPSNENDYDLVNLLVDGMNEEHEDYFSLPRL